MAGRIVDPKWAAVEAQCPRLGQVLDRELQGTGARFFLVLARPGSNRMVFSTNAPSDHYSRAELAKVLRRVADKVAP